MRAEHGVCVDRLSEAPLFGPSDRDVQADAVSGDVAERVGATHSTRLASDNRGELHFVIRSSIELLERDAVARADDRACCLQKQSGSINGRYRVVVMELSVAAHLVQMFLVVHWRRDDLSRI